MARDNNDDEKKNSRAFFPYLTLFEQRWRSWGSHGWYAASSLHFSCWWRAWRLQERAFGCVAAAALQGSARPNRGRALPCPSPAPHPPLCRAPPPSPRPAALAPRGARCQHPRGHCGLCLDGLHHCLPDVCHWVRVPAGSGHVAPPPSRGGRPQAPPAALPPAPPPHPPPPLPSPGPRLTPRPPPRAPPPPRTFPLPARAPWQQPHCLCQRAAHGVPGV
jgi:hypothetical protein